MATYRFTRHPPNISIYTRFRVKNSMRAIKSPRVAKAWRTRKLMSLTAFFRNRFYEIDRWYKARIEKPVTYPTCYYINPDDHVKSLEERMTEMFLEVNKDRQLIDIGPSFEPDPKFATKVDFLANEPVDGKMLDKSEIEKLARLRKLQLDPAQIDADSRNHSTIVRLAKQMADHCRIFHDLLHPDAYFWPSCHLKVAYADKENADVVNPVFFGNTLSPSQTCVMPEVNFTSESGAFYTLMMLNPDGCLYEENREVLHWMICNIPDNKTDQGVTVCPYLQPLPLKGTGWHRMSFILYKQSAKLDDEILGKWKINNALNLSERTFNSPEFYLRNEDLLTPVGLAFFQTEWDRSCTICFHEVLNMEQPIYDFEWPEPHFKEQEEFPEDYKPFNEYLDQYRDYKDIDKEILLKRLKNKSPFEKDSARIKFPNIFYHDETYKMSTWQQLERIKENEGYGKYRGLYENRIE